MKKIVKGNDFTLRIPVMKMVEGQPQAFPLPACTDIVVQVCNQFRRIPLAFTIDVKKDNVLLARVEGDKMGIGTYAIEVKGKIFGNDWRSNEYPQFAIVAKNADADTEFGETDEGDNSVEMDTAMVILPPTVELGNLIDDTNAVINKANAAIVDIEQRTDKAIADTETAMNNANVAAEYANKQGDRAKAYADHPNKVGEDGYWYEWDEETGEYVRTDCYSRGTIDYPTFDVNEDAELVVNITDGADKRFELSDDGELLINLNNNI